MSQVVRLAASICTPPQYQSLSHLLLLILHSTQCNANATCMLSSWQATVGSHASPLPHLSMCSHSPLHVLSASINVHACLMGPCPSCPSFTWAHAYALDPKQPTACCPWLRRISVADSRPSAQGRGFKLHGQQRRCHDATRWHGRGWPVPKLQTRASFWRGPRWIQAALDWHWSKCSYRTAHPQAPDAVLPVHGIYARRRSRRCFQNAHA